MEMTERKTEPDALLAEIRASLAIQNAEAKKQTRIQLAILIAVVALIVLLVSAALLLAPTLQATVDNVNAITKALGGAEMQQTITNVTQFLEKSGKALSEVGDAAEKLGKIDVDEVSQALAALNDAVGKLSKLDVETLNKAIANLDKTVEPFANFFAKFKG